MTKILTRDEFQRALRRYRVGVIVFREEAALLGTYDAMTARIAELEAQVSAWPSVQSEDTERDESACIEVYAAIESARLAIDTVEV